MQTTSPHGEHLAAQHSRHLMALDGDRRRTRPSSVRTQSGDRAELPPAVERLLIAVVADGFTLYCCGDKAVPTALVASYGWDRFVDLITIRNFDTITAARVVKRGMVDIFQPDTVVWAYQGPPQPALQAVLNLVHPAHPDAPTTEYPAPPRLRIPRAEQRPMTIRLSSPGRAGVRAARLAAR